jgi:energy-coupling factor transport system substrate-specific component
MTWQLASLIVVCGALAAIGVWIERSRPEPRLIALVATLAALAALGRDAFAAVPDVKPITAIVFVCGMALGAGPGFSIGALAALISNMLLGQGPWTPWQMLAWGLAGVCGALFARLGSVTHRRLLLACGAAGAAALFNLVMDFYTFTSTGSHTLSAFWLVLASASVFDLTHVLATFAFAAAFGPALLRILERATLRSRVVWRPALDDRAPLALLLVALVAAGALTPSSHADTAVSGPAAYLRSSQNRDGGWGAAAHEESSSLYTAWALIGLAAAGEPPPRANGVGPTGLQELAQQVHSLQSAGDLERTILALSAVAANPETFTRRPLVRELERDQRRDGSTEELVNSTAFAVLALRAAGVPERSARIRNAIAWLARQQQPSGGFAFSGRAGEADVDDTAAVAQALAAGGGLRSARAAARSFIERAQNRDGGFPEAPGGPSNAQSTAWAVQGLVATGASPRAVRRPGGKSPIGYLRAMTAADGAVRYAAGNDATPVWVTGEALAALAEQPFPIRPVAAAAPVPAPVSAPRSAAGAPAARSPAPSAPAAAEHAVELVVRATVEPVTQRISEGV